MDAASNKRLGELIVRLGRGDYSVLDEISVLVERVLASVGNLYYKNKADVDDAIQDVYAILCRKAVDFKENTNAYAWLVKLFENSVMSNLRKRRREEEVLRETLEWRLMTAIADEKYVENHLVLREVFDRLDPSEQKLMFYYHWCGCTVRETAKYLHKPSSSVGFQLEKLRKKFEELDKE